VPQSLRLMRIQTPRMPHGMAELLHRGGPAGRWGNLGLWSHETRYATACAALADAVAAAAGLAAGQRVLSLACGAGEELRHWVDRYQVQAALGIEADTRLAALARQDVAQTGLVARCPVVVQPALDWLTQRSAADGRFDAVLCVDAAYHLSPRPALFQHAARLLRPGGRMAFTDLTLPEGASRSPLLRAAARLCGVAPDDLVPAAHRLRQLRAAGFDDVQALPLDDAVLGGFARFVRQQGRRLGREAWHPAWLRPALTGGLIGPCRSAGLGYALFSARRCG
jgi:microcystin synthetase protein McyJ